MIEVLRRSAPILATGVVAIAAGLTGFWLGEHISPVQAAGNHIGLIEPLSDGKAVDTENGKECDLAPTIIPATSGHPELTLQTGRPLCSELAKH